MKQFPWISFTVVSCNNTKSPVTAFLWTWPAARKAIPGLKKVSSFQILAGGALSKTGLCCCTFELCSMAFLSWSWIKVLGWPPVTSAQMSPACATSMTATACVRTLSRRAACGTVASTLPAASWTSGPMQWRCPMRSVCTVLLRWPLATLLWPRWGPFSLPNGECVACCT